MKNKKNKFFTAISVMTTCAIIGFISSNFSVAYANQVDAPVNVTQEASATTAPQSSTRKAPVSIATYSDIITESADTYDYYRQTTIVDTTGQQNPVQTTSEPTGDMPTATTAPVETTATPVQSVPQGTGAPDATAEPDIITYPPTLAPDQINYF